MRILVADDDPSTRLIVTESLEEWGYKVVVASDGEAAWTILTSPNPPRIAILDWLMPGVDGLEICTRLEAQGRPFIYRLLLTSRTERHNITAALDAGAHEFHPKPIDPDILKSQIAVGVRLIEADEKLVRAERIAAIATLADGVAHQFSNANMAILGFTELLADTSGLSTDQQELLSRIHSAAERANNVTQKLLEYVDYQAPESVTIDINTVVRDAVALQNDNCAMYGISLNTDYGTCPSVKIHRRAIGQCIMHLIQNAIDALTSREEKQITISTVHTKNQVCISIADTGCGIAHNQLEDIFMPFFSQKGEHAPRGSTQSSLRGTGLGLSVAESVVRENQGSITVESEQDVGTTFRILLPPEGHA